MGDQVRSVVNPAAGRRLSRGVQPERPAGVGARRVTVQSRSAASAPVSVGLVADDTEQRRDGGATFDSELSGQLVYSDLLDNCQRILRFQRLTTVPGGGMVDEADRRSLRRTDAGQEHCRSP